MKYKKFPLLILSIVLASSCNIKDGKGGLVKSSVSDTMEVDMQLAKPDVVDEDDIFAMKILDHILIHSAQYNSINNVERSFWKLSCRESNSDFDITPHFIKETHYYAKGRNSQMPNRVAIDYYKMENRVAVSKFVDSYIKQWTWGVDSDVQNEINKESVKADSLCYYSDMTTYIYQRGTTIFFIRFDESLDFVRDGIDEFNRKENIEADSLISFRRLSSKRQSELLAQSFIDKRMIDRIKPKMRRWLSAYDLDISKFRVLGETTGIEWDKDKGTMYYKKFETENDDVYLPQFHDYSPDRAMYVDLVRSRGGYMENDTLKYFGGDDCQEIYLTSRTLKKNVMILWLGTGSLMEDCFWLDNHSFVIVGDDKSGIYKEKVFDVYDLKENIKTHYFYQCLDNKDNSDVEYFERENLSSRGCPVEFFR